MTYLFFFSKLPLIPSTIRAVPICKMRNCKQKKKKSSRRSRRLTNRVKQSEMLRDPVVLKRKKVTVITFWCAYSFKK